MTGFIFLVFIRCHNTNILHTHTHIYIVVVGNKYNKKAFFDTPLVVILVLGNYTLIVKDKYIFQSLFVTTYGRSNNISFKALVVFI